MRCHAVYEGGFTNVYRQSDLGGGVVGNLTNGECFTLLEKNSYGNNYIRFRDGNGNYASGFFEDFAQYGNLAYYGVKTSIQGATAYRFKVNKALKVVTTSGVYHAPLSVGDYVYTRSATAGASNPANMSIVAYKKDGVLIPYNGFATLRYEGGSMIKSNFCLVSA